MEACCCRGEKKDGVREGNNIYCSRILHVGQNVPCSSGAVCKQSLFSTFEFKKEQSLLAIKNFLCACFFASSPNTQVSLPTENLTIFVLAGCVTERVASVLKQQFCSGQIIAARLPLHTAKPN